MNTSINKHTVQQTPKIYVNHQKKKNTGLSPWNLSAAPREKQKALIKTNPDKKKKNELKFDYGFDALNTQRSGGGIRHSFEDKKVNKVPKRKRNKVKHYGRTSITNK